MKRILLITTGGTIASGKTESGLAPQLDAGDILRYVPRVQEFCSVDAVSVFSIDSTDLTPQHWMQLVAAVQTHYDDYDGFVITHGTDTMAYTAAALSYLIQHSPKPIVLTGAQKPISMEVTDSKTNLEDSFQYACDDASSGVVIVFGGKVILGTRARKVKTKSFNAFSSINYPPLAEIQDGRLMRYITLPKENAPLFCQRIDANIGLLKLIPGMKPAVLDFMFSCHDALILESYGVGGIPTLPGEGFYEIIQKYLKRGKLLIMTTQVPNEGSDMRVYRVGSRLKQQEGILEAYDMTTEALTAKLYWLYAAYGHDTALLCEKFYKPVANDILYTAE